MRKDIHQEVLLDLINQGYDRNRMGGYFNLSKESISYHLHKHNLNINNIKYKEKQIKAIQLYQKGHSTIEIKKMLNYSSVDLLRSLGLTRKQSEAQLIRYKKNPKQEYAKLDIPSDIMQNPEFGYWLGLVFSDGCINEHGVYLSLQIRDKELVYLFKDIGEKLFKKRGFIHNLNRPLISGFNHYQDRVYLRKPQIKCIFYSAALSRYLLDLKSLNFLNSTPNLFNQHFLSGFFDGEGCITPNDIKLTQKDDKLFLKISNLLTFLGIKYHTYKYNNHKNPINILSIGTYKHRTIFANIIGFKLDRKQNKLLETLSWRQKNVL